MSTCLVPSVFNSVTGSERDRDHSESRYAKVSGPKTDEIVFIGYLIPLRVFCNPKY